MIFFIQVLLQTIDFLIGNNTNRAYLFYNFNTENIAMQLIVKKQFKILSALTLILSFCQVFITKKSLSEINQQGNNFLM